jgi:hypothetical protein
MRFLLIHRKGRSVTYAFRGERFARVDDALGGARGRIASGDVGDFLIEDELSRVGTRPIEDRLTSAAMFLMHLRAPADGSRIPRDRIGISYGPESTHRDAAWQ